jgi:hypothetical protein
MKKRLDRSPEFTEIVKKVFGIRSLGSNMEALGAG